MPAICRLISIFPRAFAAVAAPMSDRIGGRRPEPWRLPFRPDRLNHGDARPCCRGSVPAMKDSTDIVCGPDQMRSLCKQSKQPTPLKPDAVATSNIADGRQSSI